VQVDPVAADLQLVAAGAADQPRGVRVGRVGGLEHPPDPGDVRPQRAAHVGRWVLAPHPVDEHVLGNHFAGVHEQRRQDRALARPAGVDRVARGPHLDRSQQPELHDPPSDDDD
jgi:hypothetical protein